MASGGDSLDGDGPEKVDADKIQVDYEPSWANLPTPVFHTLFSKMEPGFTHIARQVCASWLTVTEQDIGLKVKIDDRAPGNVDFVQNVKVVEARVVNWVGGDLLPSLDTGALFLFPNCLTKLTLSGRLPEAWKIKDLREFASLHHLVLRGAALHSQDLTGTPLPDSVEEYEQFQPVIEPSPIWLKQLKKLEIVMNEFSYPAVLPLSVRLQEPSRAMEQERQLRRLFFVVINNAAFILNNVRSPKLSAVQVYIYPKAGIIPPENMNWKHFPLQRFLDSHKRTLKELYLPDFEGKQDNSEEDIESFPNQLSKLQIALSGYVGDREEFRPQSSSYWKRFLAEQTLLSDLELNIFDLSNGLISDVFTSLSFSSKENLTYIHLLIQSEEPVLVNLEWFTFCHNLEILKISAGREQDTLVGNFCRLPSSLKKVRINLSLIEMPDPEIMGKFKNLEMLELVTVIVGNQGPRMLSLMRKLLFLRKLVMISLNFDVPANGNPEMMRVLRGIDDTFDSEYPCFSMKLNLSYEFESGWGEDRFDEDVNLIEYINTREPEEYSTWHRNAISVDDEDHRIFIFQTLPFLLDIRRGEGDDADLDDDDDSDSSDDTTGSRLSIFESTSLDRMDSQ